MTSTPADLLQVLRKTTKTAIAAEVRKVRAVIDGCVLHATGDEAHAAFGDHSIPLAGDGAPWVSEFAVMELGTALGQCTDSAKADHIHVNAYEVPDRLADQDALVDHHCVFPWCTRPARSCDLDHAVPYGEGGTTCSCNTAPLCRGHHRLKTQGGWSFDRGTYLWDSPNRQLVSPGPHRHPAS